MSLNRYGCEDITTTLTVRGLDFQLATKSSWERVHSRGKVEYEKVPRGYQFELQIKNEV